MMDQLFTTLNNGNQMPLLGLGTYEMNDRQAIEAVSSALEIGYRLIDTAAMYGNEKEVGGAIRSSSIKREEIFITTKLNNPDQGYDSALKAFDRSMKQLDCDYIDLYLVHWPIKGKRKDSWKALEYLCQNKMVKAIGVANYLLPFLQELESYAGIVPDVNQLEFSPFLFMQDVWEYCKSHHIQMQSYTPLIKGTRFSEIRIRQLCDRYGKTPAQVILRWNVQQGISAIPKSASRQRQQENFNIFDFTISEEDIQWMNSFNENLRLVGDPLSML
jgi:methylglyoxal/glyoxal reductase